MARKAKRAKRLRRLIRKHTEYRNSGQMFTAMLFTLGPPPPCAALEGQDRIDEWNEWHMYNERLAHWCGNLPRSFDRAASEEIQVRYWLWLAEKMEDDKQKAEGLYRARLLQKQSSEKKLSSLQPC